MDGKYWWGVTVLSVLSGASNCAASMHSKLCASCFRRYGHLSCPGAAGVVEVHTGSTVSNACTGQLTMCFGKGTYANVCFDGCSKQWHNRAMGISPVMLTRFKQPACLMNV